MKEKFKGIIYVPLKIECDLTGMNDEQKKALFKEVKSDAANLRFSKFSSLYSISKHKCKLKDLRLS